MKWCVKFPEEDILIKRPCLKRACVGNKTAAAFLSYLLYQVSISQEYRKNAENMNKRKAARGEEATQEVSIKIYRTQLEIIDEMDNEISDRTLRDTAIPLLVALKYIEVDESEKVNVYTVHLEAVQSGINSPPSLSEVLPTIKLLSDTGSTSDKYRKYFRRLAAILPTSSEVLPTNTGSTSDDKSGTRSRSRDTSDNVSRNPKSSKKSNYEATIRVVEEENQPVDSSENEHSAPTTHSEIGNLSSEEIELIRAHRQQTTNFPPLEETPSAETFQESKQAAITSSVIAEPSASAAAPACPAVDAALTDEVIVQVFEYKHGVRYDEELRPFQLQAARALLELAVPIPLSVNLLERVYDECYDEWWRSHYGDLDVSHLTEKERAGSRRIVRLIKRVQNRGQPLATNSRTDEAGGTAQNLVEWNGRMIPKEQAYREGYNGGFERYRDGEHEGDDLDAMVKKYQAQGLLPVLEKAQVGNE